EPHLKAALDLRRRVFGPDHEKVAESLVDHAWNLSVTKRYAQAESRVREALAIYHKLGDQTKPLIGTLWALMWLQVYQGRHAEAEAVANEAFLIARNAAAEEFPEIANILHTLADSKNRQRAFADGERLARQAVALHRRLHGDEHPEMGWGLLVLAE